MYECCASSYGNTGCPQLNVFGQFDCNIKKIERAFGVTFVNRGETIRLSGTEEAVGKARSVVDTLLELSRRGNTVTEQNVDYTISMSFSEKSSDVLEIDKEIICRTISGKPVKPKTVGQKKYVDEIRNKMIVFGVGPAGTAKHIWQWRWQLTHLKSRRSAVLF